MNTIFFRNKPVSIYLYNKVMNYLTKQLERGASLLSTETDNVEVYSLQTDFGTYSRFELGKEDEVYFAFSGSWDISPEFERNFSFYYGVFKTPNWGGWRELPIGEPTKVFLDHNRFLKVACGLYEVARGVVDCGLDLNIFYLLDGNEIIYIENESILYITFDDSKHVAYIRRIGDFESLSTEGYFTILEVGSVSFYAPELKTN